MTKICGILAVVGMAAGANAATSISVLVSNDGGATWSSSVNAIPGSVVRCAIFVATNDGYGFGGASITALTGTGTAGDTAAFAAGTSTGRVAPFNFGAVTNAIFATANGFRIDAASDAGNSNTAAGMVFSQRDPSSAGAGYADASVARMAFAFDVTVGAGFNRSIGLALGELVRGVSTIHTSSSATRGTQIQGTILNGASINVVPTPATLALVGLGGLVAGRRRR
jgi:uncharacterized protein (TIGR03382 family)